MSNNRENFNISIEKLLFLVESVSVYLQDLQEEAAELHEVAVTVWEYKKYTISKLYAGCEDSIKKANDIVGEIEKLTDDLKTLTKEN